MLTLGTKIKNILFVIIGAIAIANIGLNYADLGRYVGYQNYYTVNVDLEQGGGLLTNADVSYRGISVGRVGPMRLTETGIIAELRIRKGAPKIPVDADAIVASRSAVGEQYLDLRPKSSAGPFLAEGAVIERARTTIPRPVTDLLVNLNTVAKSVPLDDLNVLITELGTAFSGQGPNLQALLDNTRSFIAEANKHSDQFTQLVVDSETVLHTQNVEASAFATFAKSAKLLSQQLRTSDPDLKRLIAATPVAGEQLVGLLRDTDPELGVLVANLLTTSDVVLSRKQGLQQLLVKIPAAISVGNSVVSDGKLNMSLVTTFFNPLPCTQGYGKTKYRNGLDTSAGPALNTGATCTMPPSTGVEVRGPGNAPKGGPLPPAAKPGDGAGANTRLAGALSLPALPDRTQPDLAALLGMGVR
ncbi:MlaD family protein [Actinocorallia lasiicapitis]